MAKGGDELSADQKVDRSVTRIIGSSLLVIALVAGFFGWAYFGWYQLEPGQAAIVFRVGRHVDTVSEAGLRWHLPPPFETHEIVNVAEIARIDFGVSDGHDEAEARRAKLEATMQTKENNIVSLGFVIQYRIADAFAARYRAADPEATLRDAAQASVREVVGRMTIDDVLTGGRGQVESEGRQRLQALLDSYQMGLAVDSVKLQEVQPPEEVSAAFDDVIAAAQDASLLINQAEGYKNELLPRSRAEVAELIESAKGYREAKIAESAGEAGRFAALVREYQKAPKVTQKRLYLETMEAVLPDVNKVIIEPGTASVLPYLPLGTEFRRDPVPASPKEAVSESRREPVADPKPGAAPDSRREQP